MIGFNLVPPNLRHRSRTAVNWLRVGTIFAAALTVVVVSGTAFNWLSLGFYQDELAQQQAQVLRADILERQVRDVRRENQALARENDQLPTVAGQGQTAAMATFLLELSAAASDEILLDFIEYTRGGDWVIGGVGADPHAVAAFFETVSGLVGVQEAALAQLRYAAGEESSLRRFELRVRGQAGVAQR